MVTVTGGGVRSAAERGSRSIVGNADKRGMLCSDATIGSGSATTSPAVAATRGTLGTSSSTGRESDPAGTAAVGRFVLVVKDSGRLTCYEADTGEVHWQEQIGRQFNASPITANGLAYFPAANGVTTVIKPAETFEVVATNDLGDTINASPAVSDGQMFMRTGGALWRIDAPDRVGE